jgi:CelD/BcsL family acetyltransferase involved in cellulose biosynthesis
VVSSQDVSVEEIDVATLSGSELQAWDELFAAQTGIANPFCAPPWVTHWYEEFTKPVQRRLIWVRSGERLIGVAPFFRSSVGGNRVPLAHRLQLVGAGQGSSLLELPQILAAPGFERTVLRSVVAATIGDDHRRSTGWAEVSVPNPGWFEPEWAVTDRDVSFYRQQLCRACVVLPLAGSWEATRSSLKRNIKESLRRSRNRLTKSGKPWLVRLLTDEMDRCGVDRFLGLHQQRAEQDVDVRHPDAFADSRRREFLRELLPVLGKGGLASIYELELDGDVVAAQLVLHAPGVSYIHSSGFRADVWELGPVTHLQGEAIKDAADRGEAWVNMSPGPNVAKLRWSEQVDVHTDFAYGSGSKSLRWRYGLFAAAQSAAQVKHAVALARSARAS